MSLTVTYDTKPHKTYTVYPVGSLNSSTYRILEDQINIILAKSPSVLILDLNRLDYISSAGIRVILKAKADLKKKHGNLLFINMQPQIRKVFDIINAIPSMRIFKSFDELDEYLDAMQRPD
jgi:anti-sigma B factor antagonist